MNTWTQFTVNVNYTSNATPDSILLLFFASNSDTARVGSTLWLDDLSYSFTTGITETPANPINIYPNPANNQIYVDNQAMMAASLNLYNANGQMVQYIKMNPGSNIIDLSTLPAGIYVLSGTGANGNAYRSSVVIDK